MVFTNNPKPLGKRINKPLTNCAQEKPNFLATGYTHKTNTIYQYKNR